jgi:hypothetical protein
MDLIWNPQQTLGTGTDGIRATVTPTGATWRARVLRICDKTRREVGPMDQIGFTSIGAAVTWAEAAADIVAP